MKVAFVSFYNNFVAGARSIGACLRARSHEVCFLHLKALYLSYIPRGLVEAIRSEKPYQGVAFFGEGDLLFPDQIPITAREEALFLEELNRDTPEVIGFCTQWDGLPYFRRFADLVRQHFPGIRIVAGGGPALSRPEVLFPHADAVCTGEGEEAIVEWVEDPERTDVAGLWFQRNGSIIKNRQRPLIQVLDALPIPLYGKNEVLIQEDSVSRSLEEEPLYLRDKWVFMSGRGCPMRCSYCIGGVMAERYPGKQRVRRRSVEHFLAELREATSRLPFDQIPIQDDVFVMDEPWLEEFADRYKREIGIPLWCNACPGISTRRMFQILREAGATGIAVSLQSANDEVAGSVYRRPTGREGVRKTVLDAQAAGFEQIQLDLLVGSPYDTWEGLRETFDFLMSFSKPVYPFMNYLIRFPGTPIERIGPENAPLDARAHLFWNVLFFLTRFESVSRWGLRAIAADEKIRECPNLLDEFLSTYCRRLKYLKTGVYLGYHGREPSKVEVGTWPGLRLFLQNHFPHFYLRVMRWKRKWFRRTKDHDPCKSPS